eukprot:CAMPEP_0170067168 /NCGR_PEP_ID=MMETSP0019_2-20121128/6620_1 /TAXON_ID=98059 /ORGANISM="Dinobryon sp., Strain UTEXLB2267" /LENGTH=641 /DNA_ID=CAMNT_0010274497 /DNA_START=501 /DNA_END=2426 /DNA_ORIENTATION=-
MQLIPGSSTWLPLPNDSISNAEHAGVSQISLNLDFEGEDVEVIAAICSQAAESILVVLSSAVLFKFNATGRLLFRRSIRIDSEPTATHTAISQSSKKRKQKESAAVTNSPLHCQEVAECLWVLHSGDKVSSWSSAYGVLLRVVALTGLPAGIKHINPAEVTQYSWFLPNGYNRTSNASSGCQLLVGSTAGPASVYRQILLHSSNAHHSAVGSSLFDAVGALSKKKGISANEIDESHSKELIVVSEGAEKVLVLDKLVSSKVKAELRVAVELYSVELRREAEEHAAGMATEDRDHDFLEQATEEVAVITAVLTRKKETKFYLNTSNSSIKIYLEELEKVCSSSNTAVNLCPEDWSLLLALIRSRSVSIVNNAFLLTLVTQNLRVDVFREMIVYMADLGELHCIKMLRFCLLLPDHALPLALASVGVAVPPQEDDLKVKEGVTVSAKKRKRVVVADKKNSQQDCGEQWKSVSCAEQRLYLLQALVQAVLTRSCAYSPMLLSEAIRQALSPEMSAALLRVFGLLLQGLCVNPDHNGADHSPAPATSSPVWAGWLYSDEHVKRAVAWMEAIIDGHFATIALNVVVDESTRKGLMVALQAVVNADEAAAETEDLLGLWTHVDRVVRLGSQQARPRLGLFQVEKLVL